MLSASWVTLDFVAIGSVLHATRQVTNRDVNTMLDKTTNKEYWVCLENLVCYQNAIIDAWRHTLQNQNLICWLNQSGFTYMHTDQWSRQENNE
jgi:hypothetical protein